MHGSVSPRPARLWLAWQSLMASLLISAAPLAATCFGPAEFSDPGGLCVIPGLWCGVGVWDRPCAPHGRRGGAVPAATPPPPRRAERGRGGFLNGLQ